MTSIVNVCLDAFAFIYHTKVDNDFLCMGLLSVALFLITTSYRSDGGFWLRKGAVRCSLHLMLMLYTWLGNLNCFVLSAIRAFFHLGFRMGLCLDRKVLYVTWSMSVFVFV